MTGREIEELLLHELRVEKLAPATVNLHAAFRTFVNLVAPDSTVMKDIVKVKEIRKLPMVLVEEIRRFCCPLISGGNRQSCCSSRKTAGGGKSNLHILY
jgi:hypothetical protein